MRNSVNNSVFAHAEIPDDSIDLIVTSPPYNVSKDYSVYTDDLTPAAWEQMLYGAWYAAYRTLVPGGRLCVNVPFGTGRSTGMTLTSAITMKSLESVFGSLDAIIVWRKGTTGNRTTWGSWRSPSAPAIRDESEVIIVASKPGVFNTHGTCKPFSPWLSADDFMLFTRNVWDVPPETRRIGHPCPFPVAIPNRLIRLYGYPGCLVCDPFAGSGTTGVAAKSLGADYLLFDIDKTYCDIARTRIQGLSMRLFDESENPIPEHQDRSVNDGCDAAHGKGMVSGQYAHASAT